MLQNYIPQDIAKELKELDFHEPCLAWWFENGTVDAPTETSGFWSDWNVNPKRISAPFWQQAFQWLREKHGLMYLVIDIDVSAGGRDGYRFKFQAWKLMSDNIVIEDKSLLGYLTYDEALLECLKEMIAVLKSDLINKANI